MSVRAHEEVLVLDLPHGRLVCEHQLVMDEGRTGREMLLAVHEDALASWPLSLSVADATALRDWITARLKSGAIRD